MHLPLGVHLLFIPMYKILLTDVKRAQIAADQKEWNGREATMLVAGFQDLSTKIRLTNSKTTASLRTIILGLPANRAGGAEHLFHIVDCQHIGDYYILKHSINHMEEVKKCIPHLEEEIQNLANSSRCMKNICYL